MKRRLSGILLLTFFLCLSFQGQSRADTPERLFLLGNNQKAQVSDADGKVLATLPLDKGPQQVITNQRGEKLFLCKDQSHWSLSLLRADATAYQTELRQDASLTGFVMNREHSYFWALVEAGTGGKRAELLRINLANLEHQHTTLDTPGVTIALTPREERLIVTTVGADPLSAALHFLNAASLQTLQSIPIAKNPAATFFSPDEQSLWVTSYGYHLNLSKVAGRQLVQADSAIPAAAYDIDLNAMQLRRQIRLSELSADLIVRDGSIYAFVAEGNQGKVICLSGNGNVIEYPVDFIPRQVEAAPERSELYIIGHKQLAFYNTASRKLLGELQLNREIGRFLALPGSSRGLIYHPTNRGILSVVDLDTRQITTTARLGRGYMVAWKTYSLISGDVFVLGDIFFRNGDILALPEKRLAYIYNHFSQDVAVFDIGQNEVIRRIGCNIGNSGYLLGAPNRKYIIAVGPDQWKLINVATQKVDLNLRIKWIGRDKKIVPHFYHSSAGDVLVIATGKKVIWVDLENAEIIRKLPTLTRDAVIGW